MEYFKKRAQRNTNHPINKGKTSLIENRSLKQRESKSRDLVAVYCYRKLIENREIVRKTLKKQLFKRERELKLNDNPKPSLKEGIFQLICPRKKTEMKRKLKKSGSRSPTTRI